MKSNLNSIAKLFVNNTFIGSAWFLNDNLIITTAHSIENDCPAESLALLFGDAKIKIKEIVEKNDNLDFAILEVENKSSEIEILTYIKRPSQTNKNKVIRWYSHGYPGLLIEDFESGISIGGEVREFDIQFKKSSVIQLNCIDSANYTDFEEASLGGMSGAPVFIPEQTNKVIGIIRYAPPELGERVLIATPMDLIVHHLSKKGIFLKIDEYEENSEISKNIINLSKIASKDAENIEIIKGDRIVLNELYVDRTVEETDIFPYIKEYKNTTPSPMLIIGEAGSGKTSLLWNINRVTDSDSWIPLLLKSTFFIKSKYNDPLITFEQLEFIIKDSTNLNKKLIILLDTIDLLLHSDKQYRYKILSLIEVSKETNTPIIMTCRPQEFNRELKNQFSGNIIYLKNYDEDELKAAIDKHVNRFYRHAPYEEKEKALEFVNKLVSLGLSLREICINPLTLRMLFVLYAPEKIPPEINVFELYKAYWENRVEKDKRVGEELTDTIDLSNEAQLIALIMVAEGTPDIDVNSILNLKLDDQKVDKLITRGILHETNGYFRFFHQTFFEHSAARGFVRKLQKNGLGILKRKIIDRDYDLFWTPIYEHSLLLAELLLYFREEVNKHLRDFFEIDNIIARNIAIYIYIHRKWIRKKDAEYFDNLVKEILNKDNNETIITYFLKVAPNFSQENSRSIVIFEILDMLWDYSDRIQQHNLELLERLSQRSPERVISLLKEKDILRYFELNKSYTSVLLRIIGILTKTNPLWCWGYLILFYKKADSTKEKIIIINILCEQFDSFPNDVYDLFEEQINDILENENPKAREPRTSLGKLQQMQWAKNNLNITEILSELGGRRNIKYEISLNAITYKLMINEENFKEAFDAFKNEDNIQRKMLWSSIVWNRLLDELDTNDGATFKRHLCSHIMKSFIECKDFLLSGTLNSSHGICKALSIVVGNYNFCLNEIKDTLDLLEITNPNVWLEENGLSLLLPQAIIIKDSRAMEIINNKSIFVSEKVINILYSNLERFIPSHYHETEIFLKIILKSKDAKKFSQLFNDPNDLLSLGNLESDIQENLFITVSKHIEEINNFIAFLLKSPSGKIRRYLYISWIQLIKNDFLKPPEDLTLLSSILKYEDDQISYGWILILIGYSTFKGFYSIEQVFNTVFPIYKESNYENTINKAFLCLSLSILGSDKPSTYTLNLLEVTNNGETLRHFGFIIEHLIKKDFLDVALIVITKILIKMKDDAIKKAAKRNIANRFRKPVTLLFSKISLSQKKELIRTTPMLEKFGGALLIDAACSNSFNDLRTELKSLISNPMLHEDTKELIRRNEYMRGRTIGSEAWDEIYEYLENDL